MAIRRTVNIVNRLTHCAAELGIHGRTLEIGHVDHPTVIYITISAVRVSRSSATRPMPS